MNFFIIFYEISLWFLALIAFPKMIYSFFAHKKYRKSFFPRFGCRFPKIPEKNLPSIWIHAVSVGETKAVASLARELKRRFPKHALIISSLTETGHAEAIRSLPFADYHVYMPFDFRWVVHKIFKKAAPKLVILCESDFWYNFLSIAKKLGAGVALVNGKVSERSTRNFKFASFFSKRLFGLFDVCCVQNELYRERFLEIGVPADKITVTGNLKFDEDYPQLTQEEAMQWRQKLGIQPDQIVLTIGSTHANEEEFLIQILKDIWKTNPHLRVILVPRHPERFKEVAQLIERERLLWISFTDINRRTGKEQLILIDVMGMLRMCYQLSDFAIVGGSYTDRVGGHNILEPCWYGKPVLFGPHMYSQVEFVELMNRYKAGLQVEPQQLQAVIERWLSHPEERREIGERGVQLVKDLRGSSKNTLDALEPLLKKIPV